MSTSFSKVADIFGQGYQEHYGKTPYNDPDRKEPGISSWYFGLLGTELSSGRTIHVTPCIFNIVAERETGNVIINMYVFFEEVGWQAFSIKYEDIAEIKSPAENHGNEILFQMKGETEIPNVSIKLMGPDWYDPHNTMGDMHRITLNEIRNNLDNDLERLKQPEHTFKIEPGNWKARQYPSPPPAPEIVIPPPTSDIRTQPLTIGTLRRRSGSDGGDVGGGSAGGVMPPAVADTGPVSRSRAAAEHAGMKPSGKVERRSRRKSIRRKSIRRKTSRRKSIRRKSTRRKSTRRKSRRRKSF